MNKSFGAYARERRVAAGKLMKNVADAVGVSSVYISDIERGNRNPPAPPLLRKWAEAIGVDSDAFIDRANLARESVELRVGGNTDHSRNEIALALARAWEDLSEEEEKALRNALSDRLGRV